MSLIAVTGGIGAGKSTVLARFHELGGETLDADNVVHSLYQRESALSAAMQKRWGKDILSQDGMPDRNKIAALVFQAPLELKWLNELLHPLVIEIICRKARQCRKGLYCAIPLFFECALQQEAVFSISVWCDPKTQKLRLLQRGWNEQQIEARLQQQLTMDEKLLRGDFGIISNCSWKNLHRQCDLIFEHIQQQLQ